MKTSRSIRAMDYVTAFSVGICTGLSIVTVLGWAAR